VSEIFLISDPHFDHANVIAFGGRPFSCVNEMNEVLIEKWNRVVGKRDVVVCLGDWGMSTSSYKIASRLRGRKRLVMGNHDKGNLRELSRHFISVHGSLQKRNMLLTHIPIVFDEYHRFGVNIHGHLHSDNPRDPLPRERYININMDVWRRTEAYAPIPLEVVSSLAGRRLE